MHIRTIFFILAFACTQIGRAETIRIGAENDWYPYSAVKDGVPTGFAVDLVRAAFAAVDINVELIALPYARCMKLALESQLAGCFDTLRNPTLEKKYRWHRQPLFRSRIGIYARADHPDIPVTLADLRGKLIGTTNGYEYGAAFDGDTLMKRDVGNSDLFSVRKLVASRVDYALIYDRVAMHIMRSNPDLNGRFKQIGTLLEPDLYLAFAPKYPDTERIIALFDQGLAKLHQSGTYDRIEMRWR